MEHLLHRIYAQVSGLPQAFMSELSYISNILAFLVILPTTAAAYYQAYKVRQEARREREGRLDSAHCLEFIAGDGTCINLVPLETLHSLPKPGDVVLLPAHGVGRGEFLPGAFLVDSVEHIYTQAEYIGARPNEARLTKMVAQVTSLNPMMPVEAAAVGEDSAAAVAGAQDGRRTQ
ncbi:MAG TPA: hypothetical protein VKB38_08585 [Terracidiphilus sp.]|nr:hypothetical protein [Terracidiphilus sp.]